MKFSFSLQVAGSNSGCYLSVGLVLVIGVLALWFATSSSSSDSLLQFDGPFRGHFLHDCLQV
jgi:hypothetical protein